MTMFNFLSKYFLRVDRSSENEASKKVTINNEQGDRRRIPFDYSPPPSREEGGDFFEQCAKNLIQAIARYQLLVGPLPPHFTGFDEFLLAIGFDELNKKLLAPLYASLVNSSPMMVYGILFKAREIIKENSGVIIDTPANEQHRLIESYQQFRLLN